MRESQPSSAGRPGLRRVGTQTSKAGRSRLLVAAIAALVFTVPGAPGLAADDKVITVVDADGRMIGTSQIQSDIISECIAELPTEAQLVPVVDAKSVFLKNIAGDVENNASVRTYHATIDITYVVHQRQLVVVTMNTLEKSEPLMKEVDRRFDRVAHFESNPENGDQWAGRELVRDYYFSTPEAATADVVRLAKAWLQQKRVVMCGK